jgi:hypothetical protein
MSEELKQNGIIKMKKFVELLCCLIAIITISAIIYFKEPVIINPAQLACEEKGLKLDKPVYYIKKKKIIILCK